ncbi:MAG: SBBP repeat-containing protein, partial [candidate division KSB1 bacterium]
MRLSAPLLALFAVSSFALAQPQTTPQARLPFSPAKVVAAKSSSRSVISSLAKAEAPDLIAAAAPVREWVSAFNNTTADSNDVAFEMVLDANGNVYVTGYSFNVAGNTDIFTIKYNNTGVRQWSARYNGPAKGGDLGHALAVDGLGNVYIAGTSANALGNDDAVTLKYNSAGVLQWASRYDGLGDDGAFDLQLDHLGNVYVGGHTQVDTTNYDLLTIKYDAAGAQQWLASYHGVGSDSAAINEVALDAAQNVYVAGFTNGPTGNLDFATIKYNSAGVEQWVAFYNAAADSVDCANAIAVDANGNVYVAGASTNANGNSDYATVKYDSLGARLWVARYNAQANGMDEALDLAVDALGNVYVTGGSFGSGGLLDFATLKYNDAGVKQWVARYNAGANGDDVAQRLLLDLAGNVYVAGYSMSVSAGFDYALVGYDTDGTQQWVVRHNGTGNSTDIAFDLAIDRQRNLYVTGAITNTNGNFDFSTHKYSTLPQLSCATSAKLFTVEAQGAAGTQVYRYDVRPSGAPVLDLTLTHPSFDQPYGLAFSADKEMFISNRSAGG